VPFVWWLLAVSVPDADVAWSELPWAVELSALPELVELLEAAWSELAWVLEPPPPAPLLACAAAAECAEP
jgi:hypothetical protein